VPLSADGDVTVGRLPECGVPLAHASVSRTHARLRRAARGWEVRDEGSTHGTWVDDARLAPRGAPTALRDGAVLRFGASTRRFVLRCGGGGEADAERGRRGAAEAEAEAPARRSRSRSRERSRERRRSRSRSPRRRCRSRSPR
jgi:pSer/pThr/pTyr-binding forkhead associated (FHA) protein